MTIDDALLLLRLVGVFYLLAGIAGIHLMATDALMDKVLAALTLKPTPQAETIRRWMLVSGSFAVGVSGAALMVLSLWAVPLFLLAFSLQLAWLLWARTGYPVTDPADKQGRRQTTNATLLYCVMTVLVIWLAAAGQLHDWLDPWALFIPLVAIALSLFAARHLLWQARSPVLAGFEDEPEPRDIEAPPSHVRLVPSWAGYPLRDADTGAGVIYDDYLPEELADRLYAWSRYFHANDDHASQQFWAEFDDAADEEAHRAEGQSIVSGLRTIFEAAEGPVYPPDIRYSQSPSAQGRFPLSRE